MAAPNLDPEIAGALEAWFSAFPVDNIRKRVRVLDDNIASMTSERAYLTDQLARYDEYVEAANAGQQRLPVIDTAPANQNGVPKLTRRQAVRLVLDSDPSEAVKLSEIGDRLVADGVIEDTPAARHSLQVLVSEMAKADQVARVPGRKGFYKSVGDTRPQEREVA